MQNFTIVFTPDGRIGIYAQDGTYTEAAETISAIMLALSIDGGLKLDSISPTEQHRADDDPQHIAYHQHQHA